MGDKKRMDHRRTSVCLYSPQAQIVLDVLDRDGICFSRREYVQKKYEESAPVFLSAYDWFVKAAEAHVPKPRGCGIPLLGLQKPGRCRTRLPEAGSWYCVFLETKQSFSASTTGIRFYACPIWERRKKKRKSSARRFWNMGSGGKAISF